MISQPNLSNVSEMEDSLEEGEYVSSRYEYSYYIQTRPAGRKELCFICSNALAKYTCPKCREKTCGLPCLNRHKNMKNCMGVWLPSDPVRRHDISYQQVQKDFLYMKDMLAGSDKLKKVLSGLGGLNQEPKRFKILRANAKKMYDITVQTAPTVIYRHRENISFFFVKTKYIYWVLYLLYFRSTDVYSRHLLQPTSDSQTISNILPKDYLCRYLLESGINTQKHDYFVIFVQNKHISYYDKHKQKCLVVEWIELPLDSYLRDGLINLTIYEFPTLFIVHHTLRKYFLGCSKTKQLKPATNSLSN